MSKLFSRTDRTILGRWWWTVDRPLLGALSILILCGLMMVATASPPVAMRAGLEQYHFIIKHIVFMVPAIFIMFTLSLFSPRNIWRVSLVTVGVGMILMAVVLITGDEIKGAQRWINLGFFTLQPSEFVKPAFAVISAWMIARQKDRPDYPGYIATGVIFTIIVALLIAQPDFGMTVVMFSIMAAQIFLAGLPWILVGGGFLVGVGGLTLAYFTLSHVRSRVDRFFNPDSGDTFQIDRALEAVRHGGLFGTGAGQGSVKLSLPDAHSDFIFAVAGEEMGFVFLTALLILFAFIILRGFNRVMDSDNLFVILATGGLLVMFGIQSLIHIGSNLSVLPTKGMTLPFISYGGSSLWAVAVTMGMVLALTRKQPRTSVSRSSLSARAAMAEDI